MQGTRQVDETVAHQEKHGENGVDVVEVSNEDGYEADAGGETKGSERLPFSGAH